MVADPAALVESKPSVNFSITLTPPRKLACKTLLGLLPGLRDITTPSVESVTCNSPPVTRNAPPRPLVT